MKKKIKNVVDLRDSMIDVYDEMRASKIGIKEARPRAALAKDRIYFIINFELLSN